MTKFQTLTDAYWAKRKREDASRGAVVATVVRLIEHAQLQFGLADDSRLFVCRPGEGLEISPTVDDAVVENPKGTYCFDVIITVDDENPDGVLRFPVNLKPLDRGVYQVQIEADAAFKIQIDSWIPESADEFFIQIHSKATKRYAL